MSRPDAHPPDFEFPPFDNRDFQFSSQSFGPPNPMRRNPIGGRDPIRDTPRDISLSRDPVNIYNSPAANPYIPGDPGRPNAGGFPPSAPAPPRMFNANAHLAGGLGSNDAWAPNMPPVPPNSHRPNVGPHAVLPAASSPVNHLQQGGPQPLVVNHHHRASPPRPSAAFATPPPSAIFTDRDKDVFRDLYYTTRLGQQQQSNNHPPTAAQHALPSALSSPTSTTSPRSTLWWGELEPWMDEEYAKQVCNLMGWDPVNIKVPRPAPDPLTGRQANNPGYCFLTFPSQQHAASVLAQINNPNSGPLTMPNSSRPFTLNWASSVPTAPLATGFGAPTISIPGAQNPQYPKEYSIFVGDLAPEVSNSDLVAVFRNPVLGLRNDREPRFIRPFLSCKSAKIMLDPVTGVSRGYGFVRFTDEADQQRALIEMHGLYCLSRPMRISPATAKFKPTPGVPGGIEYAQLGYPGVMPNMSPIPDHQPPVTVALPLPSTNQTKSVSTPLASSNANASVSGASLSSTVVSGSSSLSAPSLSSNSSSTSSSTLASAPSDTEIITTPQGPSSATPTSATSPAPTAPNSSISAGLAQPTQDQLMAQRYNIPEESWKHHAQARAILSNLIGPNGEQLTSSDPYNTTVFVGGLSPLISEDTLRTFFAPFGDIHYVKVPVGKHCGFVQFVRKPDAERAIEKMQGFPIGGSRIRLSWGRSQYKAAQAAAQAAQAAALQVQYQQPLPTTPSPSSIASLTPEQAMQLLEKFGIAQFLQNPAMLNELSATDGNRTPAPQVKKEPEYNYSANAFDPRSSGQFSASSFSPFSPDPNYMIEGEKNVGGGTQQPGSAQNYTAFTGGKGYASWYTASQPDDKSSNSSGKVSPTGIPVPTARPPSANQRFGSFLADTQTGFQTRSSSRQEGPIARPDVTRRHSQVILTQDHEHDAIQDLNGTLASLDLDNAHGPWKSANGEGVKIMPTSN